MIEEMLARTWDIVGRIGGAMSLRLILQPAVALFFGIRDGLKDARLGRPAFFWTIFSEPTLLGANILGGLIFGAGMLLLGF
jgi:hypothetical protein